MTIFIKWHDTTRAIPIVTILSVAKTGLYTLLRLERVVKAAKVGKVLRVEASQDLRVEANQDLRVEVNQDLRVEASQDLRVEASQDLRVEAKVTV